LGAAQKQRISYPKTYSCSGEGEKKGGK
jgi:hypothetical protein